MSKTVTTDQSRTKPRRAYKRRKPPVPPELSAKRRAAGLVQWQGKERVPYKTIRLSARAVEMIRAAARTRGVPASQVVTDAFEKAAQPYRSN